MSDSCPCGAGKSYVDCCGPAHRGESDPPTAEALMRSRYTAYAVGDTAYLLRTWHRSTRPGDLTLTPGQRWTRLRVLATELGGPGDVGGTVEFRAHYRHGGEPGTLQELSRFVRVGGRWYYVGPLGG